MLGFHVSSYHHHQEQHDLCTDQQAPSRMNVHRDASRMITMSNRRLRVQLTLERPVLYHMAPNTLTVICHTQ
jgi:hypothetical protein